MIENRSLTEINAAKGQQPEPENNSDSENDKPSFINDRTFTEINTEKTIRLLKEENEFKIKVLLEKDDYDLVNTPIDYEDEDQFGLGMLLMHGLIDDDFKITPAGEKAYISRVKKDIAIHEGRDPDEEE